METAAMNTMMIANATESPEETGVEVRTAKTGLLAKIAAAIKFFFAVYNEIPFDPALYPAMADSLCLYM